MSTHPIARASTRAADRQPACATVNPEWFFPLSMEEIAERYPGHGNPRKLYKRLNIDNSIRARVVCGTCPLWAECLDYAVRHRVAGIWAGTSGSQRRDIATHGFQRQPRPEPERSTASGVPKGALRAYLDGEEVEDVARMWGIKAQSLRAAGELLARRLHRLRETLDGPRAACYTKRAPVGEDRGAASNERSA